MLGVGKRQWRTHEVLEWHLSRVLQLQHYLPLFPVVEEAFVPVLKHIVRDAYPKPSKWVETHVNLRSFADPVQAIEPLALNASGLLKDLANVGLQPVQKAWYTKHPETFLSQQLALIRWALPLSEEKEKIEAK